MPFSSWLRNWSLDSYRPPEKNEHTMVVESLMMELDFHIRELDRYYHDRDMDAKRCGKRVDYLWLVSSVHKPYEMPQVQRLELEELCYKVKAVECGKIITIFRDGILREPPVKDLAIIMRSAIIQIIEQRPKEETLTEWMTKRTQSLVSIRHNVRPSPKVSPVGDFNDVEMQRPIPDFQDHSYRVCSTRNTSSSSSTNQSSVTQDSMIELANDQQLYEV